MIFIFSPLVLVVASIPPTTQAPNSLHDVWLMMLLSQFIFTCCTSGYRASIFWLAASWYLSLGRTQSRSISDYCRAIPDNKIFRISHKIVLLTFLIEEIYKYKSNYRALQIFQTDFQILPSCNLNNLVFQQ